MKSRGAVQIGIALTLSSAAFAAVAGQGYGLSGDGRLIKFKTSRPDSARAIGFLTGFSGGDTALIGMDFRAQDGNLYGVGNAGGVYTINLADATMVPTTSPLTVAPSGTHFGVDFNPAADRLRIVSDNGQNLRHNVNVGGTTIADTALPNTGIVGAAYTNNDVNPTTGTTLFDLDATLNQITIQSPANSGLLAATGSLNADPVGDAGFDIWSTIVSGVTVANSAYAVLTDAGNVSTGGSVNLLTGAFTARGVFPAALSPVVDIAIQND